MIIRFSQAVEHKHGRNTTLNFSWAEVDQNLYYSPVGLPLLFPGTNGVVNATFAGWQALGHDLRGSSHTSPGFVNASTRDYRLAAGSRALQLGIASIDMSSVGPERRAI